MVGREKHPEPVTRGPCRRFVPTQPPAINFFVAKGGNFFNLFSNLGDPNADTWQTPLNPANNGLFGLSHLSFYDTGQVPEPTTLLLLGAGLFAASFARRRATPD